MIFFYSFYGIMIIQWEVAGSIECDGGRNIEYYPVRSWEIPRSFVCKQWRERHCLSRYING